MDVASNLVRTAIRTFYPAPRQILILDAILLHRVLHLEDLNIILNTQSKEVRTYLAPLRASRFVACHARKEVRVTSTTTQTIHGDRTVTRDYYFINLMEAIDAIKYRIARLRKNVESSYKQDETKGKDWFCPRCKSEYDMMEVLGFHNGPGGYECGKCGYTLVQDEERIKDRGSGVKMVRLNGQLNLLDKLIADVDRAVEEGRLRVHETITDGKPDGGFERAWEERVKVKRAEGQGGGVEERYVEVRGKKEKGPEMVKAENLEVSLKTEGELTEEERKREEERREKIRLQNQMPEWHAKSAIGMGSDSNVKVENGDGAIKREEDEEKKPDTKQSEMDDQMQQYLALIEKERAEEEERKQQEEEEDEYEDDNDSPSNWEGALGSSAVGTPGSTQEIKPVNGLKREFEEDSSEAATPASFQDNKRAKVEANGVKAESNGAPAAAVKAADPDVESDEDEEAEFEDV